MNTRLLPALLLAALTLAACGGADKDVSSAAADPAVSGRLEDGLRVLTFDPAAPDTHFTIYRGDYVRPELMGGAPLTLEIPSLDVAMSLPVAEGERDHFKVPDAGVFAFTLGGFKGEIEAIDFHDARYREASSQEAAALIANLHPVVLDVRTGREFGEGHLEGAVLIPVQELSRRSGELAAHKGDPVLVYCASGNRSTVAAKMLIDAGFERVINLRHGYKEWTREGLPVVK